MIKYQSEMEEEWWWYLYDQTFFPKKTRFNYMYLMMYIQTLFYISLAAVGL